MITFKCPHCGEPMTVPACLVGQSEKCPSCLEAATVPAKEGPSEADLDKLAQQLHHPETKVRCKAAAELGFRAQEDFDEGMREFAEAELRA